MKTDPTPSRRQFLGWLGVSAAAAGLGVALLARPAQATAYRVVYSNAEWLKRLGKARYAVLREADTEPPFTSPLNDEHRKGTFLCAGCANELYSSATKFDSGTGWPSFYQPLPQAVVTSTDFKLGYPRTEVHCADCGGHLGHVFRDGPKPTSLRYCMNGLAMTFRPA
jgi:peptide-methionine (R)-S-oxide reductase